MTGLGEGLPWVAGGGGVYVSVCGWAGGSPGRGLHPPRLGAGAGAGLPSRAAPRAGANASASGGARAREPGRRLPSDSVLAAQPASPRPM